jgi:hypothetical protein
MSPLRPNTKLTQTIKPAEPIPNQFKLIEITLIGASQGSRIATTSRTWVLATNMVRRTITRSCFNCVTLFLYGGVIVLLTLKYHDGDKNGLLCDLYFFM